MMIAGIDYSMSSPAITVGPSTNFSKCKSFFYTDKKKLEGKFGSNVYGMLKHPYEHEMERFDLISEWAMTILKKFNVQEVCLEGYAMGASGRVFHIAENTGLLKYKLWSNGIKYSTPAPTSVKKLFSGKGNSNKELMHEAFVKRTSVDLTDIMEVSADKNPISDIVDSYAMLCYGLDNF